MTTQVTEHQLPVSIVFSNAFEIPYNILTLILPKPFLLSCSVCTETAITILNHVVMPELSAIRSWDHEFLNRQESSSPVIDPYTMTMLGS